MKKQTKYFIIGLVFLIFAMLCITIIPILFKLLTKIHVQKYVYIQFEFFALVAGSVFFLFSPKYYTQIYNYILTFVTKI